MHANFYCTLILDLSNMVCKLCMQAHAVHWSTYTPCIEAHAVHESTRTSFMKAHAMHGSTRHAWKHTSCMEAHVLHGITCLAQGRHFNFFLGGQNFLIFLMPPLLENWKKHFTYYVERCVWYIDLDHMTIVILYLLEINILYTLESSVVAT